jgi:hypothetical protein
VFINRFPGWRIILTEKNINIPAEGEGKIINGRKQLEANKPPKEYLEIMQTDSAYQSETGLTPEDWQIKLLTHLEKTNQVIDDWRGQGKISFQTGAYFPASGDVPVAYWDRDDRRAYLSAYNPDYSYSYVGVRSGVSVF